MCNPTTKVLIAVSEQVSEPIQLPILIDNEVFIVTQQDIRKIEDTRHLSFRRLTNNNVKTYDNNKQIFDAINNIINLQVEKAIAERQYIQYLQEQQRNANKNIRTEGPIQMQIDLDKKEFTNQPIIKCNCICCNQKQPILLNFCKNAQRCRGVNTTDSMCYNYTNTGNTCDRLSAHDQLKLLKENQNSIGI